MKYILSVSLLLFISLHSSGQTKYWILLKNKALSEKPALSPLALERRARQQISLDLHDYPVSTDYIHQLSDQGISILQKSRWLNGVSAYLTSSQREAISQLSFVDDIRPVAQSELAAVSSCNPEGDYETHMAQLSQIGLDDVHAIGYRGAGMLIAVLDNGFSGTDTIQAFQHVWERNGFLYAGDLVEKGTSLYGPCRGSCKHGTQVLSVMAGKLPGQIMGAAPEAEYLLFRTENDTSETHQEEDNWMVAAEMADSIGADIITSSLTYRDFDIGEGDYQSSDLDGKTALVTIAAEIAASKGILVFNSAGNYGKRGIAPPADGPAVLAIGSVTEKGDLSSFSSIGPTYDGRTKPDLVARGEQSFLVQSNGTPDQANGTSFSAPLMAGFAACLWQADGKQHTAAEMRDILRQSGDRYDNPDNEYGYGIPRASFAFEMLRGNSLPCVPSITAWGQETGKIYPNPATYAFGLALSGLPEGEELTIVMVDFTGRILTQKTHIFRSEADYISFEGNWNPGYYALLVRAANDGELLSSFKLVIAP